MKMKRLLTVLLSLAIMVTFMPMMAFAAVPARDQATFNSDFSKVTVPAYTYEDGEQTVEVPEYTYNTVRMYEDGAIVAYPDPATDVAWAVPTADEIYAEYLDLSVAEFADANNRTLKAEYPFGGYTKGSMTKVKLNVPSYVANKDDATAVFGTLASLVTGWSGAAVGDEEFDDTARTEQSFELSLEGSYTGTPAITILGTIPKKEVKVNAATPDPAVDADYFFDSEAVKKAMVDAYQFGSGTKADPFVAIYDGAAHTFMASEVAGWTASYSVWDASTGKWNATSAVTLTEIQKAPTQVKIEWTKAGAAKPDDTKTETCYVNLDKFASIDIAFAEGEEGFAEKVYSVPGATYDASSYIEAAADTYYSKGMPDYLKPFAKLVDAASVKVAAAQKAELIAYFNDLYEIKEAVAKNNPNVVNLSIETKDLTEAEYNAIEKKHEKLLACAYVDVNDEDTAKIALNGVDLSDYEIEFTAAPAKKVIKTKKTKTTKAVKFTVTAECKNGTVVKYKLINAPKKNITIDAKTGKITVKKGTPKGTYSFKVKAYISGSNNAFNHEPISEVQTVKVVVKKTKK